MTQHDIDMVGLLARKASESVLVLFLPVSSITTGMPSKRSLFDEPRASTTQMNLSSTVSLGPIVLIEPGLVSVK